MSICLAAEIDGFELNVDLPSGTVRSVANVDGWEGGGTLETSQRGRPEAHGSFKEPAYMSALEPVIEGGVESPTHEESVAEERAFGSLLLGGAFGTLGVHHEGETFLTAKVRRAARISINRDSPTTFSYRLPLYSPDPYRYGPEQVETTGFTAPLASTGLVFPLFPGGVLDFGALPAPASVTLDNPGDADAWPVFEVAGPVNGFRVLDVATGIPLDFTGYVPAGAMARIDTATGRALVDGQDYTTRLRARSLPSIPAYTQRTYFFEPLGGTSAAVLTARVRPTYY